jgi:hypothetical protein
VRAPWSAQCFALCGSTVIPHTGSIALFADTSW